MSASSDGPLQAFRYGADAYLAKPFRADQAIEVIERILARVAPVTPA